MLTTIFIQFINPLLQTTLKHIPAKFWKMSRVENIVANGEIAHHEQFLLLPEWFKKSSAALASECIWERAIQTTSFFYYTEVYSSALVLPDMNLLRQLWEKGAIDHIEQFLLFSQGVAISHFPTMYSIFAKTSSVVGIKEKIEEKAGCATWLVLLNPFPHATNLQQTTLKGYLKFFGNSL